MDGPWKNMFSLQSRIWDPVELNFISKCHGIHFNWIFGQFLALELKFFANFKALETSSVKFLEICDLGVKVGSWEVKNAEMMVLWTARGEKGRLQGFTCLYQNFQGLLPPPPI